MSLAQSGVGTAFQQNTQALTYNATSGKLETLTDARGNRTTYAYDGFLRLETTRYPVAAAGSNSSSTGDYEQLSYNDRSLVTSVRLRDGKTIGLQYDDLGRVRFRDMPNQVAAEPDMTYGYDNLGRLTSAVDGTTTLGRSYDVFGRMTGESVTGLPTLTFGYDLAGRRITQGWGDGASHNFDYFTTGELWRVRENGATSGVGLLARYGYDNLGRRTGLTRGNGTVTTWSYGGTPWLASLAHDLAGTASDVTRTFGQRSAVGEIAQVTSSNDAYRFNPGGAAPGYQATNRGYTAANGLNQYPGTNTGATFGYDNRGNLTSSIAGSTTMIYGYSADNRLASTQYTDTAKPDENFAAELRYDPLDRLFGIAPPQSGWPSGTRLRYGAQGELVGEFDASGTYLKRYVHGAMADEPLVWYEGLSVADRRWYHADERGSVIAVSNGSGTASNVLSYDEHGVPGAANAGRFQYTGQTWLSEIGAYNYKARIYSPTLGRFLQTDPIGYGDGMNMYAYVGGDPVNFRDPSGMCAAGQIPIYTVEGNPSRGSPMVNGEVIVSRPHTCITLPNNFSQPPAPGPTPGNGNRGPVAAPSDKKGVCGSRLQKGAEGLQVGGDALAYPGIALAAVGAVAVGPAGAGPGLAIAEIGGTAGAIGQALEDYIHGRPGLEIAARGFVGVAGGRVAVAGLRTLSSVGNKIVEEFFDKALGEVGKRAVSWIDPDRCSK